MKKLNGIYLILKVIWIFINSFFFACIVLGKKTFASTDILVEVGANQYYFETLFFFLSNFFTSQQVKPTAC